MPSCSPGRARAPHPGRRTLRDPVTPYRWARALASDLASGVPLGWQGDGSACVDTIVTGSLVSLSVPRGGTACP